MLSMEDWEVKPRFGRMVRLGFKELISDEFVKAVRKGKLPEDPLELERIRKDLDYPRIRKIIKRAAVDRDDNEIFLLEWGEDLPEGIQDPRKNPAQPDKRDYWGVYYSAVIYKWSNKGSNKLIEAIKKEKFLEDPRVQEHILDRLISSKSKLRWECRYSH